jgi:hypothetical protein
MLSALLGYAYRAAKRIRSPEDREWLRWGLAAISIENCSKDWRDVLLALTELYVVAEEAGMRPKCDFAAVAKLSSDEQPRWSDASVREMMEHMSRYAVLKERRKRGKGG